MNIKTTILLALFFLILSCKKEENPCAKQVIDEQIFAILEHVGDTILQTDTVYQNSNVFFKANQNFYARKWVIENQAKTFTENMFRLSFNSTGTYNISFSATYKNECLEKDIVTTKQLTIVKNDGSVVSPMVGDFKGINIDNNKDTFVVSIKFWHGERYNWWPSGAYSIHNLPKGYKNIHQNFNGYSRPEIDGIVGANGYKNLVFDKSGNIPAEGIKGYSTLKQGQRDSLIIQYNIIDIEKYKNSNIISYIQKKFVGVRM